MNNERAAVLIGLNPLEFGADQLASPHRGRIAPHGLNPLEFGADQLAKHAPVANAAAAS